MSAIAGFALATVAAQAEPADKPINNADAIFGSRVEKPDGSVAMTIGRRLPTEWEAKVGTDVNLAGPASNDRSDQFLLGAPPDHSAAAIWGTITMPSPAPVIWDKTTIEARVDAGQDQATLGATLSRSVPIGQDLSVSVQNSYAITQTLPDRQAAPPVPLTPHFGSRSTAEGAWSADQSVRLNIEASGTTLSAGGVASSADDQWRRRLSVEQVLVGPLKVTTSVEEDGTAASKKSITAGFKRVW